MGDIANREMLIARWTELINDASLHDVPYKIELNAEGTIEMSPANNCHSATQAHYARTIGNSLPEGMVLTECSILTHIGVRVPDVAWGSSEFVAEQGHNTPFTRAPEICVEIVSPANSKRAIEAKIAAFHLSRAGRSRLTYTDTPPISPTPTPASTPVTAENRPVPKTDEERAQALRSMISYSGRYRVEGGKVITKVDVAWNEAWVGGEQVRFLRFDNNDLLHIESPPMPHPNVNNTVVRVIVTGARDRG